MLTQSEIDDLRAKVARAHIGRVFKRPPVRTRYHDGPLDGLVSIDESNAAPICAWCALTPRGPVQVFYRADGAGAMRFDSFEIQRSAVPSHHRA
jgi:hypothetical protein